MKKILLSLCTIASFGLLTGCNDDAFADLENTENQINYVYNITFDNGEGESRAVKEAFKDGDKVHVWFEGVTGGYTEFAYDGTEWTATAQGTLGTLPGGNAMAVWTAANETGKTPDATVNYTSTETLIGTATYTVEDGVITASFTLKQHSDFTKITVTGLAEGTWNLKVLDGANAVPQIDLAYLSAAKHIGAEGPWYPATVEDGNYCFFVYTGADAPASTTILLYNGAKVYEKTFTKTMPAGKAVTFKYDASSWTEGTLGVYTVSDTEYKVYSVEGMQWLAKEANSGKNFAGKTVKLTDDIDLSAIDSWTPIGNGSRSGNTYTGKAFKGTFDGNNKTIKGLKITSGTKDEAIGLFGVIDGGTAKDFNLVVDINAPSNENCGGVCGLLVGGGIVTNVVTDGSVAAKRGNSGIVGRLLIDGTISNCYNNATISGTSTNVGGICGAAYYTAEGKKMVIDNCTNLGSITSTGYVGGIVGLSAAEITDCTNNGAVTGTSSTCVGGIVGEQCNAGKVSHCTNRASVKNSSADAKYGTGGIIGWMRYAGEVTDYPRKEVIEVSYNTNTAIITGTTGVGGIVGIAYTYGKIHHNTNEAPSLKGTTFVAGIVGGVQSDKSPGFADWETDWHVYVNDNVSTTPEDNIEGSCKDLYVYINTPEHTTATGNTNTK